MFPEGKAGKGPTGEGARGMRIVLLVASAVIVAISLSTSPTAIASAQCRTFEELVEGSDTFWEGRVIQARQSLSHDATNPWTVLVEVTLSSAGPSEVGRQEVLALMPGRVVEPSDRQLQRDFLKGIKFFPVHEEGGDYLLDLSASCGDFLQEQGPQASVASSDPSAVGTDPAPSTEPGDSSFPLLQSIAIAIVAVGAVGLVIRRSRADE